MLTGLRRMLDRPHQPRDVVVADHVDHGPVQQLLVDGKREEAVAHYMLVASVPRDEAVRAVENVVVASFFELTSRLPINAVGFLIYAVRIFVFPDSPVTVIGIGA